MSTSAHAGVDRAAAEVPLHDDGGRPLLRVGQRGAPHRQRRRRLCRVAALQPRLAPLPGYETMLLDYRVGVSAGQSGGFDECSFWAGGRRTTAAILTDTLKV